VLTKDYKGNNMKAVFMVKGEEKEKNLAAYIPKELFLKFKATASLRYDYKQGKMKKSVIDAAKVWIWIMEIMWKWRKEIAYVSNRDYKHLKTKREMRRAIFEDAIEEYFKRRYNE
jgi:hypothetical protein